MAIGLAAVLVVVALALSALPSDPTAYPTAAEFFALGVIGLWRWTVAATHMMRATIFLLAIAPRRRRHADRFLSSPSILYAVITSYRMSSSVNYFVYKCFLADAISLKCPVRIFALITDPADVLVLQKVFEIFASRLPEGSAIIPIFQDGTGKRRALADAIRQIAREYPPPQAHVVFMDGDSVVVPGLLAAASRHLNAYPSLGAVTVDNDVAVRGHWIVREWYRLRMSQRHMLMASLAVSRKVLVLTGRFSVFRWCAIDTPEFAVALERDIVDSPRYGQIMMLTGDDKTTWFQLLKRGWDMDYLPHVKVFCLESLPSHNWLNATTSLMWRWYGNMVRNTGRAIALGWRNIGVFPWLVLVDQRISPWTTVLGPITVMTLTITGRPAAIPLYILWVIVSRGFVCMMLATLRGSGHPIQILLLYYTQVYGAVIKILVAAIPFRQKWVRQKIKVTQSTVNTQLGKIWIIVFIALLLLFLMSSIFLHLSIST